MSTPPDSEALIPTPQELQRRDQVMGRVADFIRRDERIKLPPFDPAEAHLLQDFALQVLGENDFAGSMGPFRYQFEGEDDLLHLIVVRAGGEPLTPEEGRIVAKFVLAKVPEAMIWLMPGEFSQHFYLGHDELLRS